MGNIRKYECNQCGKMFSRANDLKRHFQTVHQDIRKYECKECGRNFGEIGTLKRHIQAIHGKTTSGADEVFQPNAKPDMETNGGIADEQERMNTDQIDSPQPIYVFNMFIKKEEVDDKNKSI